jgi:outer membrane lipoprotein-sorting protein
MVDRARLGAVTSALLLLLTGAVSAQTVDQIVAKNLEARGGVEKLRAMNTVKLAGKITAQGMELPMTSWAKRPNLIRRDTKFQDQTIVVAFDGTTVWGVNPMMGPSPQALTGPQADMTREDADFDPLFLDYQQKGHRIELVGTETIEGQSLHHLQVTKKNGQVHHYYLDAETGLEVRFVTTLEQGGMKAEVTTDLSDYREVDGLRIPFAMKQSMNGKPVVQVTLETVEFNVPIDDDLFRMGK